MPSRHLKTLGSYALGLALIYGGILLVRFLLYLHFDQNALGFAFLVLLVLLVLLPSLYYVGRLIPKAYRKLDRWLDKH